MTKKMSDVSKHLKAAMEADENRSGAWNKADQDFISDNYLTMSVIDIGTQLKRNPVTVARYIKNNLNGEPIKGTTKQAAFDIKRSPLFAAIQKQFSEDEQDSFIYHWNNLMIQFKGDAPLASERLQLIDVIRLELLLNRILVKLRHVDITVEEAQEELSKEKMLEIEHRDMTKIARLEMIISNCYSSHREMNREYKDLLERKDKGLISIQASRSQRIKRIEDSRESLASWMSALAESTELRRELGIEMRKQMLAMNVELARLQDFHTYSDGSVESPILNHETVAIYDAKEGGTDDQ